MTWEELKVEISPSDARRITYEPRGALDFIQCEVPVASLCAGPIGVVMQMMDRSIRLLEGDPGDHDTWWLLEIHR